MASNPRGIWGKGVVYLTELTNNVPTGAIIEVSGTKIEFQTESELVERKSRKRNDWNQVAGAVAKAGGTSISLAFQEVDSRLMALIMSSTSTALSIAGGTEAGESITVVLGQWVNVSERNISLPVIVGSVEGVDFEINSKMGYLKALVGGNITEGASVSLAFTFGAITGKTMVAGTKTQNDYQLEFDGVWVEDNAEFYVKIPKVTLSLNSALDLLSDAYVDADFTGKVISLNGQSPMDFNDDEVLA